MQVARDVVEAHGGIGFTWECDVQIWFRRAIFDRAFLGEAGCTASARPTSRVGDVGARSDDPAVGDGD